MDERPEAQWSGDPSIAEEARRWQAEQLSAHRRRGFGGRPATIALAALWVAWLALCGVVVAASISIATAEDGAEVLFVAPPIFVFLSAVGTGLVVDIRCRLVGRGPSGGQIIGSVLSGAVAGLAVGTGLAFGLAMLFMALIGDDFSSPSISTAWALATTFLIFVLPVIVGVGGVLLSVSGRTLRGRRRAPRSAAEDETVGPGGQPDRRW